MSTKDRDAAVHQAATKRAAARMAAVQPVWNQTRQAGAALGLGPRELLHAGPPLPSPAALTPPMLNAACAALLFEGAAGSPTAARELLLSGQIRLHPAQDWDVVTPLAAMVSASMWLHQVVDANDASLLAYAPLNEGPGPAQRFGCLTPAVVERLGFVHGVLGPALAGAKLPAMDLLELAAQGLAQGDELHGRVGVSSALLAQRLRRHGFSSAVDGFLAESSQGFLNLWMAACRCMMGAARQQGEGQLLVAAGGNGIDFGIQLSGAPGQWLTGPAEVPLGPLLSAQLQSCQRLGAIGDSAVIDAVGFGAMVLEAAPEHAAILRPGLVEQMQQVSAAILTAPHPVLNRKVGVNAARISAQLLPGVCLAVLDAYGQAGLIGRGVALHPAGLYPISQ